MSREQFKDKIFTVDGLRAIEHTVGNEVDKVYILRKDMLDLVDNIYDVLERKIDNLISETKYTQSKDLVVSKILEFKKGLK